MLGRGPPLRASPMLSALLSEDSSESLSFSAKQAIMLAPAASKTEV